ncbi:MAG: hypothetical protein L0Y71_04170 [Gemmataceae bacterium]|nr:hypothetical protein [Gemmataceae bacterium]
MATVLEPAPQARAPERIRHPLQAVRAAIRKYVLLESAALAVIFLAAWFWIGLALDWGLFALFSVDWVLELQDLDESKSVAFYVRLVLLLVILGCLAALAITKMVVRLTKEFSDAAVALVLERRFPRELGDRLITAVEMADPKLAAKLGFSPAMIEKTIQDAGVKVAELPVAEVFDWARLKKTWLVAGLVSLGMLLVAGGGTVGIGAALGGDDAPAASLGDFADVSAIWAERNVLLQDSYWPRRAYLEVVRFQDTPSHPGEMRLGRDEQRPELVVRAVQWVVADRQSPDGWRALRWSDLPRFVDQGLLDRTGILSDYRGWLVDLDDLAPDIPGAVLPAAWQGKTTGEVHHDLQDPSLAAAVKQAGAEQALTSLLDWRQWTVDKIDLQRQRDEVRRPLREKHTEAHKALEDVFTRLEELTATSRMSRRLRKLTIPPMVEIVYRGETTKTTNVSELKADRKYTFDLNELKESGRFRVRGEDYWTRPLRITLVPPPSVVAVTVDKEEPAYIYHRLQGKQDPLKGKKQLFKDFPVSATGETTTIDIPFGSNVTLKARVDRELKDGIRIRPPGSGQKETGSVVPDRPVTRDGDGQGYSARFDNVVKMLDFSVEYHDLDNVKGKRRYRIRPIDDQPPEIVSVELGAVLRKPRFKSEPGKTGGGVSIDGYLITPDALLPFNGTLRDDYGLTQARWLFDTELVDVQLTGTPGDASGAKDPTETLLTRGNPRVRRSGLIASALQIHPVSLQPPASAAYWGWVCNVFDAAAKYKGSAEEAAPMDTFLRRMEARSIDEIPLTALADKLLERPSARPRLKEHYLKEEDGFDLRLHLERLKPQDTIKEQQKLYFLRLSIAAADNNIETGPATSRTKAPFFFLVIAENDLLAQVALEEEVLGERLDKILQKLAEAQTSVNEQISKLQQGGDLSLIAIRADDIRKTVLDTASVAREIQTDYVRILKELKVNRVRLGKIQEVEFKIVFPLDEVLSPWDERRNPDGGQYPKAEDATWKFHQVIEEDLAAKRTPNLDAHLGNAQLARQQLQDLWDRLNAISIALTQGVTDARTLENLVLIERNQTELTKRFDDFHKRKVQELLDELTKPRN